MKIKITPKDQKIAKNPAVKKWLKYAERIINKIIQEEDVETKIIEAGALGVPLFMSNTGAVSVVKDFYTIAPKYRTKDRLLEELKKYCLPRKKKIKTREEIEWRNSRLIEDFKQGISIRALSGIHRISYSYAHFIIWRWKMEQEAIKKRIAKDQARHARLRPRVRLRNLRSAKR